ncbi:ABC transporter permease [Reichenbachiella ulvae]|uniref:ABC transporter permease n=1 Tax=Reichenbachiella ulvae TaxID=2980104 RepID=A0ABT3CQ45_9BACT|nr:ABC transporter permease [Reichenbachiella ulvae]MCV9385767.1 ABC transporter permease [Reichenbachiella ulvae]
MSDDTIQVTAPTANPWFGGFRKKKARTTHPFWVMVGKEMADHVRSWRFILLLALLALACVGSLYTALSNLGSSIKAIDAEDAFFFLRLFTVSDGSMPSFMVFISFLGPILGIALGFDAINSEQNRGTLSRVLSQPIHRDYLINSKFVAALIIIGVMLFALGFLVMGIGMLVTGLVPTMEEFMRFFAFMLVSVLYVAFWLNLSLLFSVRFRQAATSALSGLSIWLFFTVFYQLIVQLLVKAVIPTTILTQQRAAQYQYLLQKWMSILPSQLYSDATTTLLMPKVRSLGPLTMEQMYGSIPSPLPLGQSLLVVWPQLTGLIAATLLCFGISYLWFMRREVRAN